MSRYPEIFEHHLAVLVQAGVIPGDAVDDNQELGAALDRIVAAQAEMKLACASAGKREIGFLLDQADIDLLRAYGPLNGADCETGAALSNAVGHMVHNLAEVIRQRNEGEGH